MYIEPNTTIKILKDVPLDPTYEHTIFFDYEEQQRDWFSGKAKYVLDRNSYQRVQRGYMRVNIQAENLYDCNYIMFQNTAFGTKWFYAFIKGVEYVNNSVSQIQFQIDVMQTWFFDYELEECFVEREHAATDEIGDNIVPENLELGDETVSNRNDDFDMNDMRICVLAASDNPEFPNAMTINNVYTDLRVLYNLSVTDARQTKKDITSLIGEGKEDSIVAIYQYPAFLSFPSFDENAPPITRYWSFGGNFESIDGYVPKNKKLFTYPYNFILMSNNVGQTATYRYEDWTGQTPAGTFAAQGVFVSTPSVILYPVNYKGVENNYENGLTLNSFPACAYTGDTFKRWWAQNRASVVTSGISSVLGAGLTIGATALNPALGAASAAVQFGATVTQVNTGVNAASGVANTLARVSDLKNTPPQVHGQAQNDCLNAGIGRVGFTAYCMSIKKEFARIVDDYFTRYGYATKRSKVPNRNVRRHWTFTKTIGCTIKGSIPCDDADAICSIYNNGITFWNNGDDVGQYSLDNPIK